MVLQFKLKASFLILTFLLLGLAKSKAQDNLIPNGGFENGKQGWSVWGANFQISDDAHSGSSAALISNRNNPWDALVKDITGILENNQTYNLTAWVKIPDPAVNFRITIQLDVDGKKTYHGFTRTSGPVIGKYAEYTSQVQLSWDGTLNSANMYFETESVGGVYSDYLVDDVSLVKYTPPSDVIQTGKGWKDVKSTMRVGGCATCGTKTYFNNEAAKAQVLKDCNTVNVQAYPAWGRWDETKRHVYQVDEFTSQVKEMKEKGMNVTMHMLLGWDQYFPEWFRKNDFHPDTLEAIMNSWLTAIITNEGNDTLVDVWNVVNEAFTWDGEGSYWPLFNDNYNHACEFQRMGFEPDASGLTGTQKVHSEHPVYIRKAFEFARTLTDAKLELRDAGFEFPGSSKYDSFYQLAVHLKKMNVPVDVIGFQSHLDINKNYNWEGYENNIKRYIDLGYEVHIPEVDIGDTQQNWSEETAKRQKEQYYKLVTAAIKGGATDFQTWGFIDNPNNYWRAGEKAFPYTYNYETKPAYYGVMEALVDMSSVLYWEMSETLGDTLPDVMAYNNYGTLAGFDTVSTVIGFKGNALEFDGSDDHIVSAQLKESIYADFTLQFFVKTTSSKQSVIATLISEDEKELAVGIDADGIIYVSGESIPEGSLSGKLPKNDDKWHFIAVQRDSAGYHLFVDDMQAVATAKGTAPVFQRIAIGANAGGSMPIKGAVDEVKLYDNAIEKESFQRSYAPLPPEKLDYTVRDMIIRLTWNDPADNEEGFVIERKEGESEWVELGTVGINKFIYTDVMERYETEYFYRVRSYTSAGKSHPSNVVSYESPQDPSTGVIDFREIPALKVFPNPMANKLNIHSESLTAIELIDINGKTLLQKENCINTETFDVSHFTKGIYFLKIFGNAKTQVIKLVKN